MGDNNVIISNQAGTENKAVFTTNGAVTLYYDNVPKFATTSSGIDVTGTVTADGLTAYSGVADAQSRLIKFGYSSVGDWALTRDNAATGDFYIQSGVSGTYTTRATYHLNGDVSLYASDGTTQGFFWDASEVRLGLGTTTPARNLHLYAENSDASVRFQNTANSKTWEINPSIPGVANSGLSVVNVTDNTVPLHIDNSGNVGINTAAPTADLHISYGSGSGLLVEDTTNSPSVKSVVTSGNTESYFGATSNHPLVFLQNNTERARFTSTGGFQLGQSTTNNPGGSTTTGVGIDPSGFVSTNRNGGTAAVFGRITSDGDVVTFTRQGTAVANVSVTASGATYNTTSDLRLKENIEPLEATDKLMAMNPVSYNWKADPDGPRSMGFIAQEMQDVMPEAVSAGDDEDAMMSMDYGRITPILVSALQDAHRKIEELAAEIAELKGAK